MDNNYKGYGWFLFIEIRLYCIECSCMLRGQSHKPAKNLARNIYKIETFLVEKTANYGE